MAKDPQNQGLQRIAVLQLSPDQDRGGFMPTLYHRTAGLAYAVRQNEHSATSLIPVAAASSVLGRREYARHSMHTFGLHPILCRSASYEVFCFLRISDEYRKLPRPPDVRSFMISSPSAYYDLC